MQAFKAINLAVRFLLELSTLAALAYVGIQVGSGLASKVALGIGAPLLAAVLWGSFGSPKAPKKATGVGRFVFEVIIFGSAVAGLALVGHSALAAIFGIAVVVNDALLYIWKQ
jgi:hypothetical protein